MKVAPDAPADTAMMRIVHNALRRDLARASAHLAEPIGHDQRRAIGQHLGWLMHFLHAHHESEDEGLYPYVRAQAGGDAELLNVLDRMSADHEGIQAGIAGLEAAGAALAEAPSDNTARRAAIAIDVLSESLLPHLRREEDVAMPIVSRLITHREWSALEQEHNVGPKSKSELGFEGHWLIDGASLEDRATVLGLVPPVPRFVLLHGLAGRYRRHATRCWGDVVRPPRKVQLSAAVDVTVAAPIDAVWEVVSDPTRVGEWSHECVDAAWVDGFARAEPGARFRGCNRARSGMVRWGRVCEVLEVAPYEMRWRTVPTLAYPDSTIWSIRLDEAEGGTRITQAFDVVKAPRVLGKVYALMLPGHRDRTHALRDDLQRLGSLAQQGQTATWRRT